jgi:hypothetical protein
MDGLGMICRLSRIHNWRFRSPGRTWRSWGGRAVDLRCHFVYAAFVEDTWISSYTLAQSLQSKANLSAKDAVHLACAGYSRADFFLACDDRLLKPVKRLALDVEVLNPVDYIRKVGDTWS